MFPWGENLFGDAMINVRITLSRTLLNKLLRVIREGL